MVGRFQHVGEPRIDVRHRAGALPRASNPYGLDEDYFAKTHDVPRAKALDVYLDHGVGTGALVYPGHLQTIEAQDMDGGRRELNAPTYEFRLHEVGGGVRPVARPGSIDFPLVTFDFWDTFVRVAIGRRSRRSVERPSRYAEKRLIVRCPTSISSLRCALRLKPRLRCREPRRNTESRRFSPNSSIVLRPNYRSRVPELVASEVLDEAEHVAVIADVADLYEQRVLRRRSRFSRTSTSEAKVFVRSAHGRDCMSRASRFVRPARSEPRSGWMVRCSVRFVAKTCAARITSACRRRIPIRTSPCRSRREGPPCRSPRWIRFRVIRPSQHRPTSTSGRVESEMLDRALTIYHASRAPLELRRAAFAGAATALFPLALTTMAVQSALEDGASTLHYMSREGLFLQRVHDSISAAHPASDHVTTPDRSQKSSAQPAPRRSARV